VQDTQGEVQDTHAVALTCREAQDTHTLPHALAISSNRPLVADSQPYHVKQSGWELRCVSRTTSRRLGLTGAGFASVRVESFVRIFEVKHGQDV